jgi:peptidoglycan/LPS O-acetylase OafA/YrhL
LLKSSSGSRLAFLTAAALFAVATVFFVLLFLYELVEKDEIRTGVATYALMTGAATVGLARAREWGRQFALLVTLASAGLGTLTLLSVIISRDGSPVVPAIVLVLSSAFAYWLSRPAFGAKATSDD